MAAPRRYVKLAALPERPKPKAPEDMTDKERKAWALDCKYREVQARHRLHPGRSGYDAGYKARHGKGK